MLTDNYEPTNSKDFDLIIENVTADMNAETEEKQNYDFDEDLVNWASKLSRSQRRKAISDGKKEFKKAKFSFEKWVQKLDLEQLNLYSSDYPSFADTSLPKPELELVKRGVTRYNFEAKTWQGWQLDIFDKYIKRKTNAKVHG